MCDIGRQQPLIDPVRPRPPSEHWLEDESDSKTLESAPLSQAGPINGTRPLWPSELLGFIQLVSEESSVETRNRDGRWGECSGPLRAGDL